MSAPTSTTALVLKQSTSKPVYHGTALETRSIPSLNPGEILVQMTAVAFNRRDLWLRMGMYPGIKFESVMGSDGVGIVVKSANNEDDLLQKRVFMTPMRGWESSPDAPENESKFGVVGGVKNPDIGTFAEYVVVERDQVILAPDYLDDIHLAAWPLGGLTAWRATMINGKVSSGQNVLVTGAGGGVAIIAIQLCLAKGANVYVTSGSTEKIQESMNLGAKGGVNYKSNEWPKDLGALLQRHSSKNPMLDVIIDSGGGENLMQQVSRILKSGGRLVCYGMTAGRSITMSMREVMRNQKLIGSTMGSHKDLIEATQFLSEHRIVPTVAKVLEGLEISEEGFEMMKKGEGFGKIVIKIRGDGKPKL